MRRTDDELQVYARLTDATVHFIQLTPKELNVPANHPLFYEAITELSILLKNLIATYGF